MMLNESMFDEYSEWTYVTSKDVEDTDGFMTDYTWYMKKTEDGEKHIFIFGDSDIYPPDEDYADYETDSEENAREWFDNYCTPELQESLHFRDFEEFKKIADEIGLKSAADIQRFRKEYVEKGESDLQAIKRYRAELGPDFKIEESLHPGLEELCEKHDLICSELTEEELKGFGIEELMNTYDLPVSYYCVDTGDGQQVVVAVSSKGQIMIEEDTDGLGFGLGDEYKTAQVFMNTYLKYVGRDSLTEDTKYFYKKRRETLFDVINDELTEGELGYVFNGKAYTQTKLPSANYDVYDCGIIYPEQGEPHYVDEDTCHITVRAASVEQLQPAIDIAKKYDREYELTTEKYARTAKKELVTIFMKRGDCTEPYSNKNQPVATQAKSAKDDELEENEELNERYLSGRYVWCEYKDIAGMNIYQLCRHIEELYKNKFGRECKVTDAIDQSYDYSNKELPFIVEADLGDEESVNGCDGFWFIVNCTEDEAKKLQGADLTEGKMKELAIEVENEGGKDKWLEEMTKRVSEMREMLSYLKHEAPKEVNRGGNFDSYEELSEAVEEIEKELDELLVKIKAVA